MISLADRFREHAVGCPGRGRLWRQEASTVFQGV